MARAANGRFTTARRRRRPGLFMGRDPITGTEENGVVTGETIVLGEGQTSGGGGEIEGTRTTKKSGN